MAKAKPPKPTEHNPFRPNAWGMISQIWAVTVAKGQAPILGVILIVIAIILKLPSQDVSKLSSTILHHLELKYVGGWILAAILIITTPIIVRLNGKAKIKELERISKLKNELEQQLLQTKIKR